MVRAELWATSSTTPRASIRRIISRPFGGEPALLHAVRGAAERGVEEVGRRDHPDARVGHDVHVGGIAVERVRTLDREQAGRDPRVRPRGPRGRRRGPARVSITRNVAAGACREPAGVRRRGAATRGSRRRQVDGGQRFASASVQDLVAAVVVAVDVEAARRLDRHREHLERDPALDQARDVHVAAVAPRGAGPARRAASPRGGPRPGASRGGRAPGPHTGVAGPGSSGFIRASVRATSASRTGRRGDAAPRRLPHPRPGRPARAALMRRRPGRASGGSGAATL